MRRGWCVCLCLVDKLHHIPGDLHLHSAGSWGGVVMLSVCLWSEVMLHAAWCVCLCLW